MARQPSASQWQPLAARIFEIPDECEARVIAQQHPQIVAEFDKLFALVKANNVRITNTMLNGHDRDLLVYLRLKKEAAGYLEPDLQAFVSKCFA